MENTSPEPTSGESLKFTICLTRAYLIFNEIIREEVDNFEKGKHIPSCQLMIKCEKENPSDLECTVALKGPRSPFNAFVIYIISGMKYCIFMCFHNYNYCNSFHQGKTSSRFHSMKLNVPITTAGISNCLYLSLIFSLN